MRKERTFIIASQNPKKRDELARILEPFGLMVVDAGQMGLVLPPVAETGATFAANARLKAISACAACGLPAIADDSGLVVDALDGAPGIYSARYAGINATDSENLRLLLERMAEVPADRRTARFVCAVCCVFPDGREIAAQGECEGTIGFEPAGSDGFGYDPVFMCQGRSFAQYTDAEKDAVSHRGQALRTLRDMLCPAGKDITR